METRQKRVEFGTVGLALVSVAVFTLSTIAGDLEPSAPPGPTMKTLDEVEPRIPISSVPFTIDRPGSYYLTGHLDVADPCSNAITVNEHNVTIDLMGYSLVGPGVHLSGTGHGIYIDNRRNVCIRNGTVMEFGSQGIYETNSGDDSTCHRVINMVVRSNGGVGVKLLGSEHRVENSLVMYNLAGGIWAGDVGEYRGNALITGNTVVGNHGDGIFAHFRSRITDNLVNHNGECGIRVNDTSTVSDNTIWGNNWSETESHAGISVGHNCLVKDNTVTGNKKNNICVNGNGNAIEENVVTDSVSGINFTVAGNFFANNRASQNTTNYVSVAGNTDGGGNAEF